MTTTKARASVSAPNMPHAALLIVDVQHDFIDGARAIPRTADVLVLPRIVELTTHSVLYVLRSSTPFRSGHGSPHRSSLRA